AFLLLIGCGHAKFEDDASMQPDAAEMFDATDEMSISVGDASTDGDAAIQCPPPPPQLDGGMAVVMAAQFQKDYSVYDLGNPPGVTGRLGGCTVHYQDQDTLLIAGDSETPQGAIYSIKLKRDA